MVATGSSIRNAPWGELLSTASRARGARGAVIDGLTRDGKPVPGLASADFSGAVTLVNVWASWCVPCHDEAPLLMKLAEDKRIRLVGINYKDQPDNARRFIGRYGNPFAAVGTDANGRASIDWGVYGVPETFVVGRDGRIAYKLIGPITPANLEATLKPAIEIRAAAVTSMIGETTPKRWRYSVLDCSAMKLRFFASSSASGMSIRAARSVG